MSIGNRIFLKRFLINNAIIEKFLEIPTANIADAVGRLIGMHPRISLKSTPSFPISAGRALTVKTRSGDNLMIHKALNMAEQGDVIVVSNDTGNDYRALMGEIMFHTAIKKKITGIVLDGPIRDITITKTLSIPIYATGTNPSGPYKNGTGEINVPISCGGISVSPGDLIVMDADGVVVIPYRDVDIALTAAQELKKKDVHKLYAAKDGTIDRSWVEEKILEQKTEFIDNCY